MDWYAFICLQDQKDYKAGEVCSWGSTPLSDSELAAKNLKMVYVGKYADIDFSTTVFDAAQEKFVPRPPE